MNRRYACLSVVVAVCTLLCASLSILHAQQPPVVQAMPQRIQVTVESLDVSPQVVEKLDRAIPDGDNKAGLILKALYEDQMTQAVILSLQTPNDFPGTASYDKVVGFTSKKYPGKNFVDLVTRVEATPHIEAEGFVSMRLQTVFSKASPAGLPNQIGQGTSWPIIHLKNGVMTWFRGARLNDLGQLAKSGDIHTVQQVLFVTEEVLPAISQTASRK